MRLAALVIVVAALGAGVAHVDSTRATPARATAATDVFQGLGTWIDIYDTAVYATPNALAARLAARGVRTAWIETSNDRSKTDVVDPVGLGRTVDALHARGIRIVGWYLPGHDNHARDLRRARAMLAFRTPQGGTFDGIAFDVESLRNKNVKQRTARVLDLLARLGAEAGSTPVAAITYPPREPRRRVRRPHAGA